MIRSLLYIIGVGIGCCNRSFVKLRSCFNYMRTGFYSSSCKSAGRHVALLRGARLINSKRIILGCNISIDRYTTIEAPNIQESNNAISVIIGDNVTIGEFCHITGANMIVIGDNVLTGKYVTITDNSHGQLTQNDCKKHPSRREVVSKGPVVIEECVWLGDKVTVLPGVTIGKGSIIGANAVVSTDIPPYSVAVGIPAKVVKKIQ